MSTRVGLERLDGAWWPQSRDRAVEVADLVDHFPAVYGRIARLSLSALGWEAGPARVPTARGGFVKVGSSRTDESQTVLLSMMDRTVVQLALIPATYTDAQGASVLEAAVRPGNRRSAVGLLGDVL